MLAHADQITRNASITQHDTDPLRAVRFSDQNICDIALCAAWGNFVSRFFDAAGAGREAAFVDPDHGFRTALDVAKRA